MSCSDVGSLEKEKIWAGDVSASPILTRTMVPPDRIVSRSALRATERVFEAPRRLARCLAVGPAHAAAAGATERACRRSRSRTGPALQLYPERFDASCHASLAAWGADLPPVA